MKIGSLYLWLALILSVSLNGLIVFWGVTTYRSEVLAISQNAGSDSTAMEFTLAVVASSAHHDVDNNAGDHDGKDAAEDVEKLPQEDELLENTAMLETFERDHPQRNDESIVEKFAGDMSKTENAGNTDNIIVVETAHQDAQLVNESQSEEIKSQQRRETQEHPQKQQNITKQETSTSQTRTDSSNTSNNLKSQTVLKPHNTQSQNTKNSQNAQNSAIATTRSGDQFALELASNIHSRIEGCYPESSKRRGEEGIVFLKILNQNGQLSVEIIKSSGFKRLDRCAVSAVEKILPALKLQEVPVSGITLKPIRFQLR